MVGCSKWREGDDAALEWHDEDQGNKRNAGAAYRNSRGLVLVAGATSGLCRSGRHTARGRGEWRERVVKMVAIAFLKSASRVMVVQVVLQRWSSVSQLQAVDTWVRHAKETKRNAVVKVSAYVAYE